MITAETITDEQIGQLHRQLVDAGQDSTVCWVAIFDLHSVGAADRRRAARARCAELLNARRVQP